MSTIRRVVGSLASLAGVVGVILCAAAIIGCWIAQARFVDWVDQTGQRVTASLEQVKRNLITVNASMRHTQAELAEVRRKAATSGNQAQTNILFRAAVEANKPQLHDARNTLVEATEAGLILRGILDAFADLKLGDSTETDKIQAASVQLSELIVRAEKITSKLNGAGPVKDEPTELMERFDKLVKALGDADAVLDEIQYRADRLDGRLHKGSLFAGGAITLISVWIGLGQWSLAIHGRRWGRG